MSKRLKSDLLLLLTATIWGASFVAQKTGGVLGALTYNGIRTFIGGLVLIPVVLIMKNAAEKRGDFAQVTPENRKAMLRIAVIGGIFVGLALFAASTLQQYGINFTTAGKAGFITSLYAVIVPIISIFLGKKVRPIIWLCVVVGAIGLYLLCMNGYSFSLHIGDLFVLTCAFAFAVHILVIDHFSPMCEGYYSVLLSCIQFLVAGGIAMIGMFIFENPTIPAILSSWAPILYGGIGSCGIAYTLQIVAQKDADPTEASLILCLESVFSVIAGAILLGETMGLRNYLGCALIFTAVVISQLPDKNRQE